MLAFAFDRDNFLTTSLARIRNRTMTLPDRISVGAVMMLVSSAGARHYHLHERAGGCFNQCPLHSDVVVCFAAYI